MVLVLVVNVSLFVIMLDVYLFECYSLYLFPFRALVGTAQVVTSCVGGTYSSSVTVVPIVMDRTTRTPVTVIHAVSVVSTIGTVLRPRCLQNTVVHGSYQLQVTWTHMDEEFEISFNHPSQARLYLFF